MDTFKKLVTVCRQLSRNYYSISICSVTLLVNASEYYTRRMYLSFIALSAHIQRNIQSSTKYWKVQASSFVFLCALKTFNVCVGELVYCESSAGPLFIHTLAFPSCSRVSGAQLIRPSLNGALWLFIFTPALSGWTMKSLTVSGVFYSKHKWIGLDILIQFYQTFATWCSKMFHAIY